MKRLRNYCCFLTLGAQRAQRRGFHQNSRKSRANPRRLHFTRNAWESHDTRDFFALSTLRGAPAKILHIPCKFQAFLGLASPRGAIWVILAIFTKNSENLVKWAKLHEFSWNFVEFGEMPHLLGILPKRLWKPYEMLLCPRRRRKSHKFSKNTKNLWNFGKVGDL